MTDLRTGDWKGRKGVRTRSLERAIARRIDVPPSWVLATSSCSAAMEVATLLHKEELSDPVRLTPLTYPATYAPLLNRGWDIDWIDTDDEGYPVDAVDIDVDLWGRRGGDDCVILDAAHRVVDPAHGDLLRDERISATCYSFGPTKECSSIHGGAVVSRRIEDPETRARLECYIQSGQGNPLGGGIRGYLDAPLAAVCLAKLRRLDRERSRRQKILGYYERWWSKDTLLTRSDNAFGHLCVLRLDSEGHRLLVQRALSRLGIEHSVHYPVPEELKEVCPTAYALSKRIISIPMHLSISPHDVCIISRRIQTA